VRTFPGRQEPFLEPGRAGSVTFPPFQPAGEQGTPPSLLFSTSGRGEGHGLDFSEDLKNRERRVPCSPGSEKSSPGNEKTREDGVPGSPGNENWREGHVPGSSGAQKKREDRLPSFSRDREKWEHSLPSSSDNRERRERLVPSSSRYRESGEGRVPSFPSLQNSLKNLLRTFSGHDERWERRVPCSPVAGRMGKMAFPGVPEAGRVVGVASALLGGGGGLLVELEAMPAGAGRFLGVGRPCGARG